MSSHSYDPNPFSGLCIHCGQPEIAHPIDNEHRTGDLVIERTGHRIDKITKSGVVIWPTERHTGPMDPKPTLELTNPDYEEYLNKMSASNSHLQRANATMIGGNHYKHQDTQGRCPHCLCAIEHWDWAANLRGLEYAITKHIARWRVHEKPLDCLKKAMHYTQKLIEVNFPGVVVKLDFTNNSESCADAQRQFQETKSDVRAPGGTPFGQVTRGEGMAGQESKDQEIRRFENKDVMAFIGYLSGRIPELKGVEVPKLASAWDEFKDWI